MDNLQAQSHSCIDAFIKFCKIPILDFYLTELSKLGIRYKENVEISLNTLLTQVNEVYNRHKYSEEDCWGLSDVLQNSSIVKHLRYKAARGGRATDQELVEFRNKVSLFLPETLTTLCLKNTDISTKEKYICLFVFARFSPREICSLMVLKYATLSNIRKRLYGKLFGSDGSAKEFDEKILGYSQTSRL